jgi:23S rRNA (guanosine2251-2'-O)-methyltransferase
MNRKLKLWELERLTPVEFKEQPKFPVVLILDNIRSFNNVGAFFRTADAFNVEKIYLFGITPKPPHREIQKTALGATETIVWEHVDHTIDVVMKLKDQEFKVLSVEQAEKTTFLHHFSVTKNEKYAIVFGNEVDGVEQKVMDLADEIIEVPQFGTKHSLNVSVCAGVVLWEFVRSFAD